MLFVLHKGGVPGFTGNQRSLAHLALRLEAVAAESLPFVFTDGHAAMSLTSFFSDRGSLDRVDWKVIEETSWANTPSDPDRKRRKQAELLVHRFVPWRLVERVGVYDSDAARQSRELLAGDPPGPDVQIRPHWYY